MEACRLSSLLCAAAAEAGIIIIIIIIIIIVSTAAGCLLLRRRLLLVRLRPGLRARNCYCIALKCIGRRQGWPERQRRLLLHSCGGCAVYWMDAWSGRMR